MFSLLFIHEADGGGIMCYVKVLNVKVLKMYQPFIFA